MLGVLHPAFLERPVKTLAQPRVVAEIRERLTHLTPHSSRRWGRMSVHAMVCHLTDVFRMAIGEQKVQRVDGLLHRTVVKWVALYAPLQWPGGRFPTSPELDQAETLGATAPADFTADLQRLVRMLDRLTARQRDFAWAAHPLFGPMSDAAWLRWGYLHMDHHLRQFGV